MFDKFLQIWKLKDLRNSILFVLALLFVYRIAANIPIPGIDVLSVKKLFASSQILGLMNVFSGGAMDNFSIAMLGVGPYITASIIIQLLTMIVPSLEELSKEGEYGRNKINLWTRWLTIPLALLQGFGMIQLLRTSPGGADIFAGFALFDFVVTLVSITAGTIFVMWIGELISEKKIGNGISLLIFAGIVSGIPGLLSRLVFNYEVSELVNLIIFAVIALITIAAVVLITEGQRNIPVQYARQIRGGRTLGGTSTHLPLRVNMAGVIPAIFASSILLFPASLGAWFGQSEGMGWLQDISQSIAPGQPLNILLFSAGIIFFCFFYTALMFNPKDVAENLKKSGAFIPGIRPGEQSARYIDGVLTRLTLFGALYMTAVCLLPQFLVVAANVPFYLGGTSLLIVVVVVMDFMSQVQSHLVSHQYESLMKKANLKGYGSGMLR